MQEEVKPKRKYAKSQYPSTYHRCLRRRKVGGRKLRKMKSGYAKRHRPTVVKTDEKVFHMLDDAQKKYSVSDDRLAAYLGFSENRMKRWRRNSWVQFKELRTVLDAMGLDLVIVRRRAPVKELRLKRRRIAIKRTSKYAWDVTKMWDVMDLNMEFEQNENATIESQPGDDGAVPNL